MMCFVCFFQQKTAYDMRISDWSSDVCSSDLVAGLITAVAVTDNQAVHAGDLLVKLDDRDYRAALARAEAAVAAQQAALANLDATRHLRAALVAQAEAPIIAAHAAVVRPRADVSRYRHLASAQYAIGRTSCRERRVSEW